jgi:hypothetical protein
MAIKYDGGIILGADARSANVSFKDITFIMINQILCQQRSLTFDLEYVCWQPCFR